MKIRIHAKSCHLNLRIPNCMLYNVFTHMLIERLIQDKTDIQWILDKDLLEKSMRLLKHFSKEYKGVMIVDIKTADGEIVQLTL